MHQGARLLICWTVVLGVLGATGQVAQGATRGRKCGDHLHEITMKYVTPHIRWARPYARGKLSALVIIPHREASREAVELAQRLDLDMQVVTTHLENVLAGTDPYTSRVEGTSPAEKLAELKLKLRRDYDVYIVGNFDLDALPLPIQYEILKRVKSGAGMVLAYRRACRWPIFQRPTDQDVGFITRGVPLAALPFYRDVFMPKLKLKAIKDVPGKLVRAYRFGRGRIVLLDYGIRSTTRAYGGFGLTPQEDFTFQTPTHYDYHHSLVAKAVLWASALRMPRVRFAKMLDDGHVFEYQNMGKEQTAVGLRNTTDRALSVQVRVRVRDVEGDIEETGEETYELKPDAVTTKRFAIPPLGAGLHYLDMIVTTKHGTENWASASFHVRIPGGIEAVKLGKESYERDETLEGQVVMKAPVQKGDRLRVRLCDYEGRILVENVLGVKVGPVPFRFKLDRVRTILVRVQAELSRDAKPLDQSEAIAIVPRRQLTGFPVLMWEAGGLGILGHYERQQVRRWGFQTVYKHPAGGRRAWGVAMDDLVFSSYTTRICGRGNAKGIRQPAPLEDPVWRKKLAEGLRTNVRAVKKFGPWLYSLGDENEFPHGAGFSEVSKAAFRKYLKSVYPSLDALNKQWGTSYARWDQVEPITEADAKKQKRFSQYHDHMSYMETAYAEIHEFCRDVIRAEDPRARVGAEGSQPGDMEKCVANMELWAPYRRHFWNTLLRSLAPRRVITGNWWGGYIGQRDPIGLPNILWLSILEESNHIWWYTTAGAEGLFRSDGYPAYNFEWVRKDLEQVLGGVGDCIQASRRVDQGVRVLHSQASLHADRIDPFPRTRYLSAQEATITLLENLWLQFTYTTTKRVAAGELRQPNVKVLVIPCSQAVSDAEVKEITAFVERGGVVVANVASGVKDGHGKPVQPGRLDALLGLERTTRAGKPVVLFKQPGRKPIDVTLGGQPTLAFARRGKGHAGVLSVPMEWFMHRRTDDKARTVRKMGHELRKLLNVMPDYRVRTEQGGDLQGCRMDVFEIGPCRIVGLMRSPWPKAPEVAKATFRAREKCHIYDMRAGRYLGHHQEVAIRVELGRPVLLCLSPHKVEAVTVQGQPSCKRSEVLELRLGVRTDQGAARQRVLRLQSYDPQGTPSVLFRQTLVMNGAEATYRIPFALNDPTGTWTIRVRDVLSGTTGELKVRLTAK